MVDTRYPLTLRSQRSYSNLPEEIIFDILSWLPAKSVGLCRCVSTPWRALLSQPDFIKTHLQFTKINSQSLTIIHDCQIHDCEFYSASLNSAHQLFDEITLSLTKLNFPGYNLDFDGSCDGLLLVRNEQDNMFVMNPVTREIRHVPRSPFGVPLPMKRFPMKRYLYGFGYDSVKDDYKYVESYSTDDMLASNKKSVDIYSLKTGSWKRLESTPYDYNGICYGRGVFVGGCFHWLDKRRTDGKAGIVAFDLVDEKFREVPSFVLDHLLLGKLDVVGGCLCWYKSYVIGDEYISVVWVLKEYGILKSWTKFTWNNVHRWLECFLSGQEQVLIRLLANNNYVTWNLKQGTSKEIVFNGCNGEFCVLASFVESLVSPHVRL